MKDTIYRSHVLICTGTGCVSSGAKTIKESLEEELAANDLTNE
ncbi:MAG: NADH-quinone oxidoreductase subunit F, partial [Halanaerobium sp.]